MNDYVEFYDGGDDEDDFDDSDYLSDERIKNFLTELKELTLRHKIEIGGLSMRDPYLIHTDATNGFYVLNDDEEQEGLMWVHGIMVQ